MCLIGLIGCISSYLIFIGLTYLGLAYIIVYVGAVKINPYCIWLKICNTLSFYATPCFARLTLKIYFDILNLININDLLLLVSLYRKKLNPWFLTKNDKSGGMQFITTFSSKLCSSRYFSTSTPCASGASGASDASGASEGFFPVKFYGNADTDKLQILTENKGKAGVYRWTNLNNEKTYIGSSIDLGERLQGYFKPGWLKS